MINKRKCPKCNIVKSFSEFNKNKTRKHGVSIYCKKCNKAYRVINKKHISTMFRLKRLANLDEHKKRSREYYTKNAKRLRELAKRYRADNPQKYSEQNKRRRLANINKIRKQERKWHHKRMQNYIYKLNYNIGASIRLALKGNKKGRHWEDLVGYRLHELVKHLELRFKVGMSWENRGEWHIDHIIPISLWEFNSPEDREFKQCWSLANLQPLWASENLSKGCRV